MELRVLRYFLAVAREQNITSAAQVLHITQPTLSKQLMDLEEELGKKLLVRGSRKITLTEEGLFLQKRAQEILDLTDKTEAAFHADDQLVGGEVFIGAGETDAMHCIAKVIKRLCGGYPGLRFHLHSGNGEDVSEWLDKGLIDFGLFVGAAALDKYDYVKLPTEDTWGLLMRKDHPLASQNGIAPKDFAGLPLLCSRQALIRNELAGWLGDSLDRLKIIGTYNLLYNASILVEEGLGCALSIDGLINTSGNSRLCFIPLQPKITASLVVAWKKYQVFSKSAQKFLTALQQELHG